MMKIKFIKDFMATQSDDYRDLHAILIKRGDIVDVGGCEYNGRYFDMPKEQSQWLIDNGFAEEVKESNSLFEELTHDDRRDRAAVNIWFRKNRNGGHSKKMVDFIQFMEAINVVSQDEGFMVPYKTLGESVYGFGISFDCNDGIYAESHNHQIVAGELYFDSEENATTSIEYHPEEWETILNYNWGRE